LKKSDYLTRNDKMQQREGVTFSFDLYNSTNGELLDFFNKATSNAEVFILLLKDSDVLANWMIFPNRSSLFYSMTTYKSLRVEF